MSDVLGKTLASLPGLAEGLGVNPSRGGYQNFVKNVMSSRTKYEEDQVLLREISIQKQKLVEPNMSTAQKRDSLVRLLYCHMLGKDVSFACIHAVKLAQQGSILQKKVGYLVCSMMMSEDHELVMLLVNTMQKDLASTNIVDNLAALTAISHLCSAEMVPAMLPLVKDKLKHERDAVRRRAVLCLHRFLHRAPEMVLHDVGCVRAALSDRDPSVVWAAVNMYDDLVQESPGSYLDLVPGFLGILGQVIGRRLPSEYDYHTVPAPWLTIVLLRVLGCLGAHSQSASADIYPALRDVLQRTEASHKMGLAVIFECVQTAARLSSHPGLGGQAVSAVGRFLAANSVNLKYLGLKALSSMVTISPGCTVEHQDVVLDCLEHSDVTIQRQTLELLYQMASVTNVEVISARLLAFMASTTDAFIRQDICRKVTQLTHKFSANLLWYVQTMNTVVTAAEDTVPGDTAASMIATISRACVSRGDESDPLSDRSVRADVFSVYWQLLHTDSLPHTVMHVGVWVLGEFSHCVPAVKPASVLATLVHVYRVTSDLDTRVQVVSALQKLAYYISNHSEVVSCLRGQRGLDRSLVQRINELENLCKSKHVMKVACNPETRPDVKKLDFTLSFLDDFVCKALEQGAAPYKVKSLRDYKPSQEVEVEGKSASNLSFAPYQAPQLPYKKPVSYHESEEGAGLELGASASSGGSSSKESRLIGLKSKNARRVWGPEGIIKEDSPAKSEPDIQENVKCITPQCSVMEDSALSLEQQKRKELASALFGGIQVPEQNMGQSNAELVNISYPSDELSTSLQNDPPINKILPDQNIESNATHANLSCTTRTTSQDINVLDSLPPLSPPVPPSYLSPAGFASPESMNLLAHLSLQSPEDQVLAGSMYASISDPGTDFVQVPSSSTLNERQEPVDGRDSLEVEKTMYDEINLSMVSSASDDFVRPSEIDEQHLIVKDSHPSPWKMLGPRRVNRQCEDSTEDSISIEVDSIEEDDPPKEFNVESPKRASMNPYKAGVGLLESLEPLPKSEPVVVFHQSGHILKCQKVFKSDSLVLVLYFTLENSDNDNHSATTGTLQINDMTTFNIKIQPVVSEDIESSDPHHIPIPGSTLVNMAPSSTIYSTEPITPVNLTFTLPGSDTKNTCQIWVDVADFLRPSDTTIDAFGQLWSRDIAQEQTTLNKRHDHLDTLQDMGFNKIQTIGGESILAANWLDDATDTILAHCQTGNDIMQITFKGLHKPLVSSLSKYLILQIDTS